jgi:hypothetical protein
MHRRSAVAVLLALALGLAVASPATAKTGVFRAKPTNITCVAFRIGENGATMRCDLPFLGRRAVFLHTRGKARITHVSAFLHPRHPTILGPGAEAHFGAFNCESRRKAVTCRTGNGHGFTVGRSFQLTF